MSGLPVYLPQGMISVYTSPSMWGMFNPNENNTTRFGYVEQSNSEDAFLATGITVMYDESDVKAPVFYNGIVYHVLPSNKVIATEFPYYIAPDL